MSLVGEAYRRSQGNPDPVRPEGVVILSRKRLWLIIAATITCTSLVLVTLMQLVPESESVEVPESTLHEAKADGLTSVPLSAAMSDTMRDNETAQMLDGAGSRDRSLDANFPESGARPEQEDKRVQDLYRARAVALSKSEVAQTLSESADPLRDDTSPSQSSSALPNEGQSQSLVAPDNSDRDSGLDSEAILQQAQKLLQAEAATRASRLPTIEELPEADRDRIPTLLYSAHDFQPRGESRVMINRTWYGVGERLTGRLTLSEIRESDILVDSDDGFRFIVPALASWVNL